MVFHFFLQILKFLTCSWVLREYSQELQILRLNGSAQMLLASKM